MHVKFIARGTGSAKAAVDYLLGERAAAGKLRDGVEVRRGDPDIVAASPTPPAWSRGRPTRRSRQCSTSSSGTAWAVLEPDRYGLDGG